MRWHARCLVTLLLMSFAAPATCEKVVVGIAPVYDGGGEVFGPAVSQHLTLFTYEELLNSPVAKPALLSPGGVYSPLDPSWVVEYVQDRKEITLLLLGVLKPAKGTANGHSTIAVDFSLLDARAGDVLSTWTVSVEISTKKTALDSGAVEVPAGINPFGRVQRTYLVVPSRKFEKQPLGKATAHLASQVRESLESKLASIGKAGASPTEASPSATNTGANCPVHVQIAYGYKHSVSRSYQLMANGLDQSTNIVDGVATFSAPEGELLLQFDVNDSPYKMEKEALYQLNTTHVCSTSSLIVDLGKGGDAHLRWE